MRRQEVSREDFYQQACKQQRDAFSTYRKHPLCVYSVTAHHWASPRGFMPCTMPPHLWLLRILGPFCEEPHTGNFMRLIREYLLVSFPKETCLEYRHVHEQTSRRGIEFFTKSRTPQYCLQGWLRHVGLGSGATGAHPRRRLSGNTRRCQPQRV